MTTEETTTQVVVDQANTDSAVDTATQQQQQPAIPEKFGGDVNKLVESYNHLESKIGTMYSLPTEDSSPEKWNDFSSKIVSTGKFIQRPDDSNPESLSNFYNQIGRPESPDKYSPNIDEDMKGFIDDGLYQQFTQVAYDAGLTNQQTQQLMDFELKRVNAEAEQYTAAKSNAEASLRQSWGADYDNRMAGAKAAANAYADKYPEAVNELLNGPAGNNPALIAMLSELGHSLKESGHAGAVGTPQYGMSSDIAKDKIREIMDNKSHPYYNSHDPAHHEAVEKVKSLYQTAYPEN
jgi:hypothetical protein